MTFLFGDLYNRKGMTVEADTIEFAIYKFAYTVDDIYAYVNDSSLTEYDYHLGEYILKEDCYDKAQVNIYIDRGKGDKYSRDWKLVRAIALTELEKFNFSEVEKQLSSKGHKADSQEIALLRNYDVAVYSDNLPQEFKDGKIQTIGDFNRCQLQIKMKMAELQKKKDELESQVKEMKKWIKSKYRVICAYETYLGTNEEVVELIGEGETSDEPIHLYQAVRFMDEEYGIVNLENLTETTWVKDEDFDYKNIELFDDWITKNYKMFIPSGRGIVMWRIKRRDKEYNDKWENMVCNGINANCYFLIRNGERLYRIFSDVSAKEDTMFPTESQSIKAGMKWYSDESFDMETFQENILLWKYILVAIQGILDRTDILGKDCQFKTNLLCGLYDKDKIVLVRDLEESNRIGDNRMPYWKEYLKANRDKTRIGDRIIITELFGYYSNPTSDREFISYHKMDWRRRWVGVPNRSKVYEVKDYNEDYGYKILYFEERYYGDVKRKRTALWLSKDEFFNISQTTEQDIQYYLNDRRERTNYLDMLPKMKLAYKYFKTKAYEREDYFREHFCDN